MKAPVSVWLEPVLLVEREEWCAYAIGDFGWSKVNQGRGVTVRVYVQCPSPGRTGRAARIAGTYSKAQFATIVAKRLPLRFVVKYRAADTEKPTNHHRGCHCKGCRGTNARREFMLEPLDVFSIAVALDKAMEEGKVKP